MNVRRLFRGISRKLTEDFRAAAEINHHGSRGSAREDILRSFLASRLPKRFAVGSGEVVVPERMTSSQEDLIVYDAMNSVPLTSSDSVQVYPVESVYGVIEVKSKLSKAELLDSLEKVRSVKALAPKDIIQLHHGALSSGMMRPAPFGMIFAYSLADNSISTLSDNLREWERENAPDLWPNCVAVLGEGVIFHLNRENQTCVHSQHLTQECGPLGLSFREDSLFHFYVALLDILSDIQLGPTRLREYYDMPERIGGWKVKNHDKLRRFDKDTGLQRKEVYRIKSDYLSEVIEWSQEHGKMSGADACRYMFGNLPEGKVDRDFAPVAYIYNPDNLPHGQEALVGIIEARVTNGSPPTSAVQFLPLTVDGQPLWLPCAYLTEDRVELIPDIDASDL